MARRVDIVHIISSLARGGAEQIALDVISHYHQQGHQQAVWYYHDGPHRTTLEAWGIPTVTLRQGIIRGPYPTRLIISWLWMANFVARALARIFNVPHIATFHHMPALESSLKKTLDRWLPAQPTCAVAVSPEVHHAYAREHPWCTAPWVTIPNGIDTRAPHAPVWQSGHTLHLLTIGRFVALKRIDRVIDTLSILHCQHVDAHLTIVGHGPDYELLRTHARTLGVEHAITWVINQDAQPWYQKTHLYIQLSSSESFSLTTATALAHCQPVIVSGHPVLHPLVTDGVTGHVIPHADAAHAARVIQAYLQDPTPFYTYAQEAHRLAHEQYARETMLGRYDQLRDQYSKQTGL